MIPQNLQESLHAVFDSQPERSDMIIRTMDNMHSVAQDKTMKGTAINFLHLNQISDYVDGFLERKDASPDSFAPPVKPKKSSVSRQDTDLFVGKTVDFSIENWDKKQQQNLLETDFKADISPKKAAEEKGTAIKQERISAADNKNFLSETKEKVETLREALNSREAVQGAAKGFLTGGKVGAAKGYCTAVVAKLAKNKREHDLESKCDSSEDTSQSSTSSSNSRHKM